MPALDRLTGTRIVADPAAIDALVTALPPATVAIRPAPDDVFLVGADDPNLDALKVGDPYAIVEAEHGFFGGWCTLDDIRTHLEWLPPTDRPALAQGSVAGVPAKLWIVDDGRVLLVAAAAHAHVLAERLGWSR